MKLFVGYKDHVIRQRHSDEPYSRWSETHQFLVRGVCTHSRTWDSEVFEVAFDVEPGTPLFVVWMTYTTGDSFGQSSGNGEIIWVFRDSNAAFVAMNLYNAAFKMDEVANSITFNDGEGNKITMSNPASGHFGGGGASSGAFILGV